MEISDSQFSKKNVPTAAASFARKDLEVSAEEFEAKALAKGQEPVSGENTASSAFGFEENFGGQEYGGISHFKLRTRGTPSH